MESRKEESETLNLSAWIGGPWPSQPCTQGRPGLSPAEESALGSHHHEIWEEDVATFDGLLTKASIGMNKAKAGSICICLPAGLLGLTGRGHQSPVVRTASHHRLSQVFHLKSKKEKLGQTEV